MATKRPQPKKKSIQLPTKPTEPSDVISDYHFLIHGEKKIGKTTLASEEDDTLVVTADPIRPGLSILQLHVTDWTDVTLALKELKKQKPLKYVKIVVDRVDLWYTYCQDAICKKFQIDHPSEEGWARAWHALRDEFQKVILGYMNLPCGVWFICHSEWREKKSRYGVTKSKLIPDLAGRAEEILNGFVDGWFAYDYDGDDRVLYILGDETIGAGHSLPKHFQTSDGRPISELPMGKSPSEAYEIFCKAFNNRWPYTTIEEWRESKKKRKKKTKVKKKRRKS